MQLNVLMILVEPRRIELPTFALRTRQGSQNYPEISEACFKLGSALAQYGHSVRHAIMATIRKRSARYQAIIRRKNLSPVSRTFATRSDAQQWARRIEREMDMGTYRPEQGVSVETTLQDLLHRYLHEVTPTKKGAIQEGYRIRRLLNDPLANNRVDELTAQAIASYRDARLSDGTEAARYDMTILQVVINVAMREWGLELDQNPVSRVQKPKPVKARERRIRTDELQTLLRLSEYRCGGWLRPTILLAIETGMRRSELLSLRWADTDLDAGLCRLHDTKNGRPRAVPLSSEAIDVLAGLPRGGERVLPLSVNALALGWKRLIGTSGIKDLRFHDLRHEAISRLFERGLNVPEVALISGHRTPSQLFRYTNLKAEAVAAKLRADG